MGSCPQRAEINNHIIYRDYRWYGQLQLWWGSAEFDSLRRFLGP